MNLIYLRPSTPKARKFIKKKLRPAAGASPEMTAFLNRSGLWAGMNQN